MKKNFRYTNKYRPLTPLWKISQSFCKLLFLPVTSCENFLAVMHVLAFQSNQLLHHFVGYLQCLLYAHVDFVICNDYGKNKMGTEADLIKQKLLGRIEAEAAEEGKNISASELSGNHRNRMYCLSPNENCLSKVRVKIRS